MRFSESSCYRCVVGCSGLRSAARPAAGEGGLDPEVLRSRDFQGAVEESVHGAERRPSLHLRQGGENSDQRNWTDALWAAGSSLLDRPGRTVGRLCQTTGLQVQLIRSSHLWSSLIFSLSCVLGIKRAQQLNRDCRCIIFHCYRCLQGETGGSCEMVLKQSVSYLKVTMQ